jgi:hypothetical protein
MQGWGSILSLVVSTGALVFTGWLLRHEIRVRREEKADNEATQARLVVGTVIRSQGELVNGVFADNPATSVTWRVKNYSQAPIFDVELQLHPHWGHDVMLRRALHKRKPVRVGIVEDEEQGMIEIPPTVITDELGHDLSRFQTIVTFTDASGVRWRRTTGFPPDRLTDWFPPTKAQIRKNIRRQRWDALRWHLGRWKLWTQVKVFGTRKPAELEAYGTEYDPIPF